LMVQAERREEIGDGIENTKIEVKILWEKG
jgi:hypothetical protein